MAVVPPARVRMRALPLSVTLLHALVLVACSPQMSAPAESVAAIRFNGTWAGDAGEFRLWAQEDQRLLVEFRGEYRYESSVGPMVNVGTGEGFASVEDDTARFRPDAAEPDCAITLRLIGERLEVSEAGACGFGLNVTAEGMYRRVSSDQPQFGAL